MAHVAQLVPGDRQGLLSSARSHFELAEAPEFQLRLCMLACRCASSNEGRTPFLLPWSCRWSATVTGRHRPPGLQVVTSVHGMANSCALRVHWQAASANSTGNLRVPGHTLAKAVVFARR